MKTPIFLAIFVLASAPIAISQPVAYEIYALKFASVGNPIPLSYLAMDAPEKEKIDAVFMIWLVKGTNGKNILVDAGFRRDIEEAKDYNLKNYVRPDSMLMRIGLTPGDITDIVLTHPHWDHMDGIDLFQNAQVWMQKDDFEYFIGDAWQKNGNHGGFNKRDVLKLIHANLSGRLTLVDGDARKIIPGITVYTGSRHTYNSQYVLAESGPDKIIIASDNVYTYYNLEQLKSALPDATFDTHAYVSAMERMKTLVTRIEFIIPGHDGLLYSRFPVIAEGVIKIK